MCTVKTSKATPPVQQAKEKPVQVLRNRYLDGIPQTRRAQQIGVGTFRIDRTSSGTARVPSASPASGASPSIQSLAIRR